MQATSSAESVAPAGAESDTLRSSRDTQVVPVAFDSRRGSAHEKKQVIPMATDSATLIIQCQIALQITQKQLGDLVGRDRRTIQRWQDRGCIMLPLEAKALADALRPTRPDLADQVLGLGRDGAAAAGMAPEVTPEVIAEILKAARAAAGGVAPMSIRAAVTAALTEVAQGGFDVRTVVAKLRRVGGPSRS